MSIAIWSSGKRSTSASGNATNAFSTASAHGSPCVSYSNGSSMKPPSYQPATTRTCAPSARVASPTNAIFAPNASASVRTSTRRKSSPTAARRAFGDRPQQLLAAEPGCTITERSGHRLPDGSSSPTRAVSHPTNPAHDPRSGRLPLVSRHRLPVLRTRLVATFPIVLRAAERLAGGLAARGTERRVHVSHATPLHERASPTPSAFVSQDGRLRRGSKLVGRVSTPEGLRGVRWGRRPTSRVSRCDGHA